MSRFTIRGNVAVRYHSSAPANLAAISVATELGTDQRGVAEGESLAAMDGWESSASTINTPDVLSLQTGNIPGEVTFPTGTLKYYTDDTTNAIFAAQVEGTDGYISIWPFSATPATPTASEDYTIFSIEVIDRSRALATANEAEMHTISYSIQSRTEGTSAA